MLLLIRTLNFFHETKLHNFLATSPNSDTAPTVDVIGHLKPKSSNSIEHTSALHLKFGGEPLVQNLVLLMHITLHSEFYPLLFALEILSQFPKKENQTQNVHHFDLLRIRHSFAKSLGFFFRSDLEQTCYTLPHQFGFKRGIGCADVLTVVANAVIDVGFSGECLILASHDIRRGFDLLIYPVILLKMAKRERMSSRYVLSIMYSPETTCK